MKEHVTARLSGYTIGGLSAIDDIKDSYEFTCRHTFLIDVLHAIAQALLAPDIILLLLFIAYALFTIGNVIVEFFTERRNFSIEMPQFRPI